MKQTFTSLQAGFWSQDRRIYYYNASDKTQVGGYYRSQGNFYKVTVPKSGHFMPNDNYWASKAFLDDFVSHKALTCTDQSGNECRVNKQMCEFMNLCNGVASCLANGQCICQDHYHKGADCSYRAYNVEAEKQFSVDTSGTEWFYVIHQNSRSTWKTSILSSDVPFSVYLSYGADVTSNPNQFSYDMFFKEVQPGFALKLSDEIVPDGDYVAAIKVHGYDTLNNKPLANKIEVKVEAGGWHPIY